MAEIVVGSKKYIVPDVVDRVTYTVSSSCFRGVRKSVRREIIMFDLGGLIVNGHALIKDKEIPTKFNEREIKFDMSDKLESHDSEVQKMYLRETRGWWESHYSLNEMKWMTDFQYFIPELGGKVGDNWFRLYQIIRGDLPDGFPTSICFSAMIENVCHRYIGKYISKTIQEYLVSHPEGAEKLKRMEIPDDLILDLYIGLDSGEYFDFVRKYGIPDKVRTRL